MRAGVLNISWQLVFIYRYIVFGNKTDYVPKDIQDVSKIGYFKKKRAKKAIRWLLSIAPLSVEEIADHFEMSPELVKGLLWN